MGLNDAIRLLVWLVVCFVAWMVLPILWEKRDSIVAGFLAGVNHFVEVKRSPSSHYTDHHSGSHTPEPHPHSTGTAVPRGPEPAWDLGSAEDREPDRDGPDNLTEHDQPYTWEGVVRELARIEMLDSVTGKPAPLSVKRIAALVGKRHEEVAAIVREEREYRPEPGERILRVKDSQGPREISWEA